MCQDFEIKKDFAKVEGKTASPFSGVYTTRIPETRQLRSPGEFPPCRWDAQWEPFQRQIGFQKIRICFYLCQAFQILKDFAKVEEKTALPFSGVFRRVFPRRGSLGDRGNFPRVVGMPSGSHSNDKWA